MDIKFRAKDYYTKDWRYGVPVKSNNGICLVSKIYHNPINPSFNNEYHVDGYLINPDTLCRLVTIKDGIEFYEHDILEDFLSVRWNDEDLSFDFYWTYSGESTNGDINWYENDTLLKEVLGNIFDNPEMVDCN